MTQEELNDYIIEQIKPIVEAAVLAEREACAKVCEKRETSYQYATDPWALEHIMEAQYCAAAIRARGEK